MALEGKNGVTVKLYNSSNELVGTTVTSTIDGVVGSYEFTNIPYGTYQVYLDPTGVSDYDTFKNANIIDIDDTSPGRTVTSQGTYGVTDVDVSGTQAVVAFQYNKTV